MTGDRKSNAPGLSFLCHSPLRTSLQAIGSQLNRQSRRIWFLSELNFLADKIFKRFAAAHQVGVEAVDKDLRRAGTGVVVGSHDRTVGTRRECGDEYASIKSGQIAILGQKVTALAYRSNNIPGLGIWDLGLARIWNRR